MDSAGGTGLRVLGELDLRTPHSKSHCGSEPTKYGGVSEQTKKKGPGFTRACHDDPLNNISMLTYNFKHV